MKKTLLSSIFILFCIQALNAQWIRTDGPYGNVYIHDLERSNSALFAATDAGIFVKHDGTIGWEQLSSYPTKYLYPDGDSIFTSYYHSNGFIDVSNSSFSITEFPYTGFPLINAPPVAHKDSVLYIASSQGVFVSNDLGQTSWQFLAGLDVDTVNGMFGIEVTDITATDSFLYCSTKKGLYRSDYSLTIWEKKLDGNVNSLYKAGSVIYTQSLDSIYISQDNGDNWISMEAANSTSVCEWNNGIYRNATAGVLVSQDTGKSWSVMNTGLPSQKILRVESLDGNLYCVENYGHIYKWNGAQWVLEAEKGLINTWMRGVETTDTELFALDVGTGVFKYNHDNTWSNVSPVFDSSYVMFEDLLTHKDTLCALVYTVDTPAQARSLELCYSADNGQTWVCADVSSNVPMAPNIYHGLLKYDDGYFFIYNEQQVLRSAKLNGPWEDISPIFTSSCPGSIYHLTRFGGKVYISGCDANTLRYYDENQQIWVRELPMFLSGYKADLIIERDTFLFVNAFNGMYRRSLNSTSWTKVGALDTADLYASDYLNVGSSMYVVAGRGLYRSADEGLSWTSEVDSLPVNWGAVDVELFQDSLFLALYSRGVYKRHLPEDLLSISEIVTKNESTNIFPNPASEFFVVNTGGNMKGTFSIIDQGGRLLHDGGFTGGEKIDIPDLDNGIYLVKVTTVEGTFDTKLIIAH